LETSEHEIIQRVLEKFVEPKSVNKTGFQKEIREVIDRYGEEEEKKKGKVGCL
jgi:3-hydroxyisobutyryl-CoA hydrolase